MAERIRLTPKNKRASFPSTPGHLVPFGPPPVIYGEDPEAYNKIVARGFNDLKPRNFFEEDCATDYADLKWTIDRVRRQKASYLNRHIADGLKLVLAPLLDYDPVPGEEPEKDGIAQWQADLEAIDPFEERGELKYQTINLYLQRLRSAVREKQQAARDAQLDALVDPWVKRDPDAIKKVDAILDAGG
jgi:hypothetical protein